MTNIKDAISIRYNNLVYDLKAAGKDPIVLSLGESYFDIPTPILSDKHNPNIFHYSHSKGLPELRSVLSKFYENSYQVKNNASTNIIISAGSKVLVYLAMKANLGEGDEIVIPEPAWVSYSEQAKLCNAKAKFIPIGTEIKDFHKYISNKTKVLILCNPHNPTGYNHSKSDLLKIFDLCKKNNIVIFSDEAYSEFIPEGEEFISFGEIDKGLERSVIFNSLSKNIGVSGWRIGFALSNEETINAMYKLNQHIITCAPSALEYYSADNFDKLLDIARPQISNVMLKRLKVEKLIKEQGLKYMPGTATFYFFIEISESKLSSIDFCDILLEKFFVAVVPGIGYGPTCDGYIRLSFGTESLDRISRGLKSIAKLISGDY